MLTLQQLWLAGGSSSRIGRSAATGHTGAKVQLWANLLTPTLLPTALAFPTVSPSSPAASLFLGSHLLPSRCSGTAELLASTFTASPCWLLPTSTKAVPHAGAEQSHSQTGAMTLEGKCRWHGSSSSVAVGHGAAPAPAAGMAQQGGLRWNGSSAAAPGSRRALSLRRPSRDGTGPSRPSWRIEAEANSHACSSHITAHISPPPPCPGPGPGATGLQHPFFIESQGQPWARSTSPAQFPDTLSPVGPSLMGRVGASHESKRGWVLAPAPTAPSLSQHPALSHPRGLDPAAGAGVWSSGSAGTGPSTPAPVSAQTPKAGRGPQVKTNSY